MKSALRNIVRFGRRLAGIDEHKRRFNRIYLEDEWGGGSGPGSSPQQTAEYRGFLTAFIRQRDIKSVIDVGCGDWQFSRLIDWSGVDYTGLDVSSVVLGNTKRFAKSGIRFIELNAAKQEIPAADLLIAKDVIQHWRNQDVQRFIPQLQKFKYALITNVSHFDNPLTNSEGEIGGFRPVDLTAPPFNLPGRYVFEFVADEPKITFLWENPR